MIHADTKDPTVKRILSACEITNRNVSISGASRIQLAGTKWDGGYKTCYTAVSLITFEAKALPVETFGAPEMDIPGDVAIVAYQYAGTRNYVYIYVHPDNLTRMVSAPDSGISEHEAIVLCWTQSLKNTYAGESDIRFKRASRSQGITRLEWDSASESLKARKLLNKAGAITPDGRNAVEGHPLRWKAH